MEILKVEGSEWTKKEQKALELVDGMLGELESSSSYVLAARETTIRRILSSQLRKEMQEIPSVAFFCWASRVIYVIADRLEQKSIGKMAEAILHELFHAEDPVLKTWTAEQNLDPGNRQKAERYAHQQTTLLASAFYQSGHYHDDRYFMGFLYGVVQSQQSAYYDIFGEVLFPEV